MNTEAKTKEKAKTQIKVITGNGAAAIAAKLARPDVVAAYPITPQTEIIEQISKFHATGEMDCELIQGYFYSEGVSAERVPEIVSEGFAPVSS